MQLRDPIQRHPRLQMQPIRILRDQIPEHPLIHQGLYRHMRNRRDSTIYNLINPGLGSRFRGLSVPDSRARAYDGVGAGSEVGDSEGC